jgi:hypothetical protein
MSGNSSRKPLIIVGVCAAVAVLVLVFGVSCGGGNDARARDWQDSFSDSAKGEALTAADLEASGGTCTADGTQLLVAGSCVFVVKEFGGALGLGPPTKRANLVPQQAVVIQLFVQGTRIEQDVDPGKAVPLTFGTAGGRLGVTCLSVGSCTLQLTEQS